MSFNKFLTIILRAVFVFSSLFFLYVFFHKWDGYSYYINFLDIIPRISLAFILWTIPMIAFAFILWVVLSLFFRSILRFFTVKLEHISLWVVLFLFVFLIKEAFLISSSFEILTGLHLYNMMIFFTIITGLVTLVLRKKAGNTVNIFNTHITPLVWLFAVLFIAAIPFAVINIIQEDPPDVIDEYAQNTHVSSTEKPNIILVIMDALTAHDMHVYGYERPTTPFITRWAEEAFVFNRAYSASHWTTPAAMSLMTGQNVWTHRLWYYAYNNPKKIKYENNLAKVLREGGYNNYGFVQNKYASPRTLGIDESFLVREYSSRFNMLLLGDGLGVKLSKFFVRRPITREMFAFHPLNIENIVKAIIQKRSSVLRNEESLSVSDPPTAFPPELVYNRFLLYAQSAGNRLGNDQKHLHLKDPFFAWLFTLPPHDPFLPPETFRGVFGDEDNPYNLIEQGPYDPEDQPKVNVMRKRYDEFIMYCDKEFEKLIKKLENTLDMSNTVIILTSDHGESFSHNYFGHTGKDLNEQKVHIPLIIKLPGINKKKTIDLQISQIDIAPTILDLAGIKVPAWMEGRSLVPIMMGKSLDSKPVFSMELIENRSFGNPITKGTIAIWDGDYKFVYYLNEDKAVLFNLKHDPEESHDIFEEETVTGQRLKMLVEDNLKLANTKFN